MSSEETRCSVMAKRATKSRTKTTQVAHTTNSHTTTTGSGVFGHHMIGTANAIKNSIAAIINGISLALSQRAPWFAPPHSS